MLITGAQPRKKGMTALFIDGEYAVSIDTVTFLSSGYKTGSEINDDELYEMIETSNNNRAKEKALYLIEYRSRTAKELSDKLVPLFGESASSAAIERLEELGLINDEAYAREYAQQLMMRKHYPRQRALYELIGKGIERELAEEILDEIEPDPEEQIRQLLRTKYSRRLADERSRTKAVNALRGMGFNWSDIRDVMSEEEFDFEE